MGTIKLFVDIGSTFAKVVAVDLDALDVLSRAQTPSKVEEDVTIGLRKALNEIGNEIDMEAALKMWGGTETWR
jgi:hypothetical protein